MNGWRHRLQGRYWQRFNRLLLFNYPLIIVVACICEFSWGIVCIIVVCFFLRRRHHAIRKSVKIWDCFLNVIVSCMMLACRFLVIKFNFVIKDLWLLMGVNNTIMRFRRLLIDTYKGDSIVIGVQFIFSLRIDLFNIVWWKIMRVIFIFLICAIFKHLYIWEIILKKVDL